MISLRWGSATDVGMVRESNQDSMLTAEPLFAVADGMGGHQGGEVASATALEILETTFKAGEDGSEDDFREAVRRANAKVWDKAQLTEELRGMGTTLTGIARVVDAESEQERLLLVNVGDSRGYLFRDGELQQLTEDHSLVQEMVRSGQISAEEAEHHPRSNIVTRAMGVEPTVEADYQYLEVRGGDRVLLCSDGLVREVSDDQVASVLRRLANPDDAAKELVAQAKAHGGHDNITVVIVDVESTDNDGAPVPAATSTKAKARHRAVVVPARKHGGRLTLRMVLFFTAVLGLLGVGAGSVVWYARSAYYVSLDGEQLVIYRGRPESVLWFDATVAERTNITTAAVLPTAIPALKEGAEQSSLRSAHEYIVNLTTEARAAQEAAAPPSTTSTSTVASRTRRATTTTVER